MTADLAPPISAGPLIALTAPVSGLEVNVATPDVGAWGAIETALRGTPTVNGVTLLSLSLGGTSRIRIGHSDSHDWLIYNLDQRGLRIDQDEGGGRLRRKAPGDVAVVRPLTADEIEARAAAAAGTATTTTPPRPASPEPATLSTDQPT